MNRAQACLRANRDDGRHGFARRRIVDRVGWKLRATCGGGGGISICAASARRASRSAPRFVRHAHGGDGDSGRVGFP